MKKTNVLFSFFAKGKALWVSLVLISAFFFLGAGTASAQLVPKNATPLQKMQAEFNWLTEKLAPLPPSDPYHATFAPYMAFLTAMIQDMTGLGMSFHAAMAKNRALIPQAPYPASAGLEGSGVLHEGYAKISIPVNH
jgi:hypothetical protein